MTHGKKETDDGRTKEMDYLRAVRHYHCIQVRGSYARANRIGQKRVVSVYRLHMQRSMEDKKAMIAREQENKFNELMTKTRAIDSNITDNWFNIVMEPVATCDLTLWHLPGEPATFSP